MAIDNKINNIREALIKYDLTIDKEKIIIESILDILEDISCELDELNESLTY